MCLSTVLSVKELLLSVVRFTIYDIYECTVQEYKTFLHTHVKMQTNSRKSLCTNRIVMLKDVLAHILVPRINWYEVKLWIARATFFHDGLNCYHKPW